MGNLNNYLFSEEHIWVRIEGNEAYIGISDHAQQELGDLNFIERPNVGLEIVQGESFTTIESRKAVSDIYAPMSGKIIEINDAVVDVPEKVNEDPYGSWIFKISLSNISEKDSLLTSEQYDKYINEED